jgi:hypothetical protein
MMMTSMTKNSLLIMAMIMNVMSNNTFQVNAAPLNDLITELPGYGRPPTPQFSGYLDASAGCDVNINGPICKIHYWLALANEQDDTSSASTKPTGKFIECCHCHRRRCTVFSTACNPNIKKLLRLPSPSFSFFLSAILSKWNEYCTHTHTHTIRFITTQHNTTQHNAMQCNAMQYY